MRIVVFYPPYSTKITILTCSSSLWELIHLFLSLLIWLKNQVKMLICLQHFYTLQIAQSDVMLSVRIHFISFSVRRRMKMTQMSRTKKNNWIMLFLCFQCAKLDFKHVEKSSWIRSRRRICCCDAGLMIFHSLVYFLPVALALLGDVWRFVRGGLGGLSPNTRLIVKSVFLVFS